MTRFVLALLILLMNEKVDLNWQLKEGFEMTVSWVSDLQLNLKGSPKTDAHMKYAGTLTVGRIAEGNAECELLMNNILLKGVFQGKQIDICIEDGTVKSSNMDKVAQDRILQQIAKPMKVSLGTHGEYAMREHHPLGVMFAGKSNFFGPELSEKSVAVGEEWTSSLRGPVANAEEIPVKYKLTSVENGQAKIALDEITKMTVQGIVIDLTFKTEASFDIAGGYCASSKSVVTARSGNDQPGVMDSDATIEFKAEPIRKRHEK